MRVLAQALVTAAGGTGEVLKDLIASWPEEDEILAICWRASAAEMLESTKRPFVRIAAQSTEEALLQLRFREPAEVRGFRPDVIWSQAVHMTGQPHPQAVHYHDIGSFQPIHADSLRQRAKSHRERRDLRRTDLRIFNSVAMRDAVWSRHPSVIGLRHAIIPNGLDLAPFWDARDGAVKARGEKDHRVLIPQSDSPHKRNWLAGEVLAHLRDNAPDLGSIRLTVAGSGEYRDLRQSLKDHGMLELAQFVGYVSRVTMARLYAQHDAVLMTGLAESFGNPIVEAHALGVPVVTPPMPVAIELAGPCSRIASDDSVPALAEALRVALISRPSGAERDASLTYSRAFSAGQIVRRLRDTLQAMARRPGT
jgi:glycosyltransferase involved in cell wall biosynthesis